MRGEGNFLPHLFLGLRRQPLQARGIQILVPQRRQLTAG
jgi:hypothetical protein